MPGRSVNNMALSEAEELELLELEEAEASAKTTANQPKTATDFIKAEGPRIAQQALEAADPVSATRKFFKTDPETMQRVGGGALPVMGGALGGPVGAAAGELARQATGTVFAPDTVPETALGRAASVAGAGVIQDPKMLKAIPGVSSVGNLVSSLATKAGKGLAKGAQALSGGRAGDFIESARKGYATYGAPSKQEAGKMMEEALEKLPGGKAVRSMAERMETALTPESSSGAKMLNDVAKRIDSGELIDARQALKAKQSLDAVIDTVPIWQTKRRAELFDLKRTFDEVLSSQSGELKEASNAYRAAALKNNMTKWLPVNKHGEYSRLAPMLSSLGGVAAGMNQDDAKKGAAATAGYLLATSPLAFGAGATTIGQFGKLASNPAVRQALLQAYEAIKRKKNSDGAK